MRFVDNSLDDAERNLVITGKEIKYTRPIQIDIRLDKVNILKVDQLQKL